MERRSGLGLVGLRGIEAIVYGGRQRPLMSLALRVAQRRAVDANGLALVAQAAEQSLGQLFVAEQYLPLIIFKVGGQECGLAAIAFFHEFEEDVGLLGA